MVLLSGTLATSCLLLLSRKGFHVLSFLFFNLNLSLFSYLSAFSSLLWPNALLASASNLTSALTGIPTGVKVT
jgi:hypothetical protein